MFADGGRAPAFSAANFRQMFSARKFFAVRKKGVFPMAKKYVCTSSRKATPTCVSCWAARARTLAEDMTDLGMPVPQGFTVTTEACTRDHTDGKVIGDDIVEQIYAALAETEKVGRQEVRRRQGSFSRFCPLRRSCLHARHDGYHSESGPDGRVCCGVWRT